MEPPDPTEFIMTLTNMVLLTYVHLRAHHSDVYPTAEPTARKVVDLTARGYLPRTGPSGSTGTR